MRKPIAEMPGRYIPIIINGHVQYFRDKATLQADVVALLRAEGHMPKKRILTMLRTAQRVIDDAMLAAEAADEIERYRKRSSRGRMDEFWCLKGQAPNRVAYKIQGAETLAAFQAAAAAHYRVNSEGTCQN